MDFIEKIVGVSPDGGNGSLEALFVFIAFIVPVLLFVMGRHLRERNRRPS